MLVEILLLIAACLFFVTIASLGWGIGTYNTFRIGQQDIKTQWSNILTEYQRRADLLYNLVQAVKSHKKFEKETLVEVIKARNGNFGPTKPDQIKKLGQLDGLFNKLMVLFERYPKLQSNEQHNKLMEEVRITEDRINIARTDYNEIVGDYNKLVQMFPSAIIAGIFKFNTEAFFEGQEGIEKAPDISTNLL